MRLLRESSDEEMVARFLEGELGSERFGEAIREALLARGHPEALLTQPDLADAHANQARRALLADARGYGEDRDLFEHFPAGVGWVWARLTPAELAQVRYIEYSYWKELSGGSRLPVDAASLIRAGTRPWGISNERFTRAAEALLQGKRFPPLILAGSSYDEADAGALAGVPPGQIPADVPPVAGASASR